MKRLFQILILLFCAATVHGEQYTFALTNCTRLATGREHFISVEVRTKKCEEIVLTADNGNITQNGCKFVYVPSHAGNVKFTISVKTKSGSRRIGDTTLAVHHNKENPVVRVSGKSRGAIPLAELLKSKGPKLTYPTQEWVDEDYTIYSYTCYVVRKSDIVYEKYFTGHNPTFDDKTTEFLKTLQLGDSIIFDVVVVRDIAGIRQKIGGVSFEVFRDEEETDEDKDIVTEITSRKVTLENGKGGERDSSLAVRLIHKAKQSTFKAFPWTAYDAPIPLNKVEIGAILNPKADTIEIEDVNGTMIKKVLLREFDYSNINTLKVLEKWKHSKKNGTIDIAIISVAPMATVYNDDGTRAYAKPLFWLDYNDIKEFIRTYDLKHPEKNFGKSIWEDYMKREE